MTRPRTYDTDAAEAADDKADREWWRRPDPFDPANTQDPVEAEAPYPFCRTPAECAGKGYCPKEFACND